MTTPIWVSRSGVSFMGCNRSVYVLGVAQWRLLYGMQQHIYNILGVAQWRLLYGMQQNVVVVVLVYSNEVRKTSH